MSNTNLVNELQISAEQDDVLTVLRKTRRLASKLARQDIADWLDAEQNAYGTGPVPDYRKISTSLAYNTNGPIPIGMGLVKNGIEDLHIKGMAYPVDLRDSISTVLSMIEGTKAGNAIYWPINEGTELSRLIRQQVRFNPLFARQITFLTHLNETQIVAIPERIKDKVLEWACALEAAGVTGDGMSFSPKEKEIAHSVIFNISDSRIEQLTNAGFNLKGGQ
jgi:hypothetical protein